MATLDLLAKIGVTEFIAIAGLTLSIINTVYGYRSRKLSQEQHDLTLPNLISKFSIAYSFDTEDKQRIYSFKISIDNRSRLQNSISFSELLIETKNQEGLIIPIRVPNTARKFEKPDVLEGTNLEIPTTFAPYETKVGWLNFPVPHKALDAKEVIGVSVIVTDTHGKVTALSPLLITEYVNEV